MAHETNWLRTRITAATATLLAGAALIAGNSVIWTADAIADEASDTTVTTPAQQQAVTIQVNGHFTENAAHEALDAVNAVREEAGLDPVELSGSLSALAQTRAVEYAIDANDAVYGFLDGSGTVFTTGLDIVNETLGTARQGSSVTELIDQWLAVSENDQPEGSTSAAILSPDVTQIGFALFTTDDNTLSFALEVGMGTGLNSEGVGSATTASSAVSVSLSRLTTLLTVPETMERGDNAAAAYTILIGNTPVTLVDDAIWSSSDVNVVNVDAAGILSAVDAGTATISFATDDAVLGSATVVVEEQVVDFPDDTNDDIYDIDPGYTFNEETGDDNTAASEPETEPVMPEFSDVTTGPGEGDTFIDENTEPTFDGENTYEEPASEVETTYEEPTLEAETTYEEPAPEAETTYEEPADQGESAGSVVPEVTVETEGSTVHQEVTGVNTGSDIVIDNTDIAEIPSGETTVDGTADGSEAINENPTVEEPSGDEVTTEVPSGEEVTTEEPSGDEVTTEEPSGEEPTAEEPGNGESSGEQLGGDEVITDEPSGDEVTTEEPSGEEPATEEPSSDESTVEEPDGDEVTTEEPSGEEMTTEEPAAEEPSGDESTVEEPDGDEMTTEEPNGEEVTTEEPIEEPSGDESTVEEPDGDEVTTEEPNGEEVTTEEPTEEPNGEETAAEEPDGDTTDDSTAGDDTASDRTSNEGISDSVNSTFDDIPSIIPDGEESSDTTDSTLEGMPEDTTESTTESTEGTTNDGEDTGETNEPTIVSIDSELPIIYVQTDDNGASWLPTEDIFIDVTLSDGENTIIVIEPDAWTVSGPNSQGIMYLTLTIEGTELTVVQVVQFVNVIPDGIERTYTVGDAIELPDTLNATYEGAEVDIAVTWDDIPESALTTPGTYQVTGTLDGGLGTVVATITVEEPAPTIQQASNPAAVTTTVGTAPVLPSTVAVTYSDDTAGSAKVTWDSIDPSLYAKAGSFTVSGTVEGTVLTVSITVIVEEPAPTITNVATAYVTTVAGETPQLPATVEVTWSDGVTALMAVTWDSFDYNLYMQAGSFTVSGTIDGHEDVRATCVVTVEALPTPTNVLTIEDVSTPAGTAPALPDTVEVLYSDGTVKAYGVVWNSIDAAAYHNGGSFIVDGTVDGLGWTVSVKVIVADPYVTGVQSNLNAQTIVGIAPKLPDTASVRWSNGDITSEPVSWPTIDEDLYAHTGTFTVTGLVANYEIPCTVTVTEQVVMTSDNIAPTAMAAIIAGVVGLGAIAAAVGLIIRSRRARQ